MPPVAMTTEEALAAVRAAAWTEEPKPEAATCGHPGCTDHPGEGRRMIHVLSGFGMDIPLESVEQEIREARRLGWVNGPMGHDLACQTTDGKIHYYEVKRPPEVLV